MDGSKQLHVALVTLVMLSVAIAVFVVNEIHEHVVLFMFLFFVATSVMRTPPLALPKPTPEELQVRLLWRGMLEKEKIFS
jgi:hypothetical protein